LSVAMWRTAVARARRRRDGRAAIPRPSSTVRLLDWLRARGRPRARAAHQGDKLSRKRPQGRSQRIAAQLRRDYPGTTCSSSRASKRGPGRARGHRQAVDAFRPQKTRAPAKGE
jgi:hypothetical protein